MSAVRNTRSSWNRPRHNWSPEARQLIIAAVKENRMLRREVAELYNGKLDGGQPLTIAAVTGILHRHDAETRQESERKRQSASFMRLDSVNPIANCGSHRQNILTLKHLRLVIPADPLPAKIYSDDVYFQTGLATGIAALYLENMLDGQCRMITSETPQGISLCCGAKCERKPRRGSASHTKFYSFCESHRSIVEQPSSEKSKQRFERNTTRYLSRQF